MNAPASLTWFARHEFGLFWRDWLSMMTAGKRHRERLLATIIAIATILMHGLALLILTPFIKSAIVPSIPVLVFIGGIMLLALSLMLSQAMESVTRAFYARDDLDLILSSPAMVQRLFAVRISAIAISTLLMTLLLALPFINILIFLDGPQWLAAYGVLAAMAAGTTAIAAMVIVLMFKTIGAARTRFVAQLIAAIVGATFVIGIQIIAIIYYGNISRLEVLTSDMVYAMAPHINSLWWMPVRALTGEVSAFATILIFGFGALSFAILFAAPKFGNSIVATGSVSYHIEKPKTNYRRFRNLSAPRALRHKEWVLLMRDPWLISQTLMQILYLLPPAFLLWRNFSGSAGALAIVVPVIVMAAGQLAGGLAWLAVSGEDAPDLVSTAPIPSAAITRAKIEAVMISIGWLVAPLIVALAFADLWTAMVTATGVTICALSSVIIQLWFRKQARRTHFRRRQISSRAATFAEALSSILWAGTAGIAVTGSWLAAVTAIAAIIVMLTARAIAPTHE